MGKLKHEPEYIAFTESYDRHGKFKGPPARGAAALEKVLRKRKGRGRAEGPRKRPTSGTPTEPSGHGAAAAGEGIRKRKGTAEGGDGGARKVSRKR